jgi:AICAR transformylase/IMP cyclohydrolase PurH
MMSDVKIKRALLSVSDKTGLVELGHALGRHGVELISTGGTAKALRDGGLAVRDISDLTGFPEMMDGRVKTLHPKVHGGLLAVRDDPEHQAAMEAHGIGAIDLVVVNLYPFAQTVARGADRDEIIENIDIGGPSMVRSAAKNHAFVAIVTDPGDYGPLIEEMERSGGMTSLTKGRCFRTCWRLRRTGARPCATARTRISRRRSTSRPGRTRGGLRRPGRSRARSSATTIITTPMRRWSWSRSFATPIPPV